jgi:hypothetical protein
MIFTFRSKYVLMLAIIFWLNPTLNAKNLLEEGLRKHTDMARRQFQEINSDQILGNYFDEEVVKGPTCTPLLSKNINANPYHSALLSIPRTYVRRGHGLPELLPVNPFICPLDSPTHCTFSVTKSMSIAISDSYSISLSNSKTYSKSIGNSQSKGASNAYTKSISRSLDMSLSRTITQGDDESISNSVSDAVTKTHEKAIAKTKSKSNEDSETLTLTNDETTSNTITNELSLSKALTKEKSETNSKGGSRSNTNSKTKESTFSHSHSISIEASSPMKGIFGGVSASMSHTFSGSYSSSTTNSRTEEENWSNTFSNSESSTNTESSSNSDSKMSSIGYGRSNGKTVGHSSSSSDENRESDSISSTRDASRTKSKSLTNSNATSETNSKSFRIDDSYTNSNETTNTETASFDNSSMRSNSLDRGKQHIHTVTINDERSFPVAPGKCKIAACFPIVRSIPILHECSNRDGIHDIVPVEYMVLDSMEMNNNQSFCAIDLIDCNQLENDNYMFKNINDEYNRANGENSLEYGEIIYDKDTLSKGGQTGLIRWSTNGDFLLKLEESGNLVLMHHQIVVWKNDMGFFKNYIKRVRINEKGHFIQEVKGLFSASAPNYRQNEWITVWSSAPINHNVTIGVPKIKGHLSGYKLIVENVGDLNLYDSIGTLIWSATKQDAKHRFGYKFPEVYLVPTNFLTPEVKNDKHNSLDSTIIIMKDLFSQLVSIDRNCNYSLKSQEAIESPNKRFKMILEPSGNMIIKDGYRTMWETASANLPFAKPPYQLLLTGVGNLMIVDSRRLIVWRSLAAFESQDRPFVARLSNEGRLIVLDSNNQTIWNSWPTSNMSFGETLFVKVKFDYPRCFGVSRTSLILSNVKHKNQMHSNESLESENNNWTFHIKNKKELLLSSSKTNFLIFSATNGEIESVKIKDNGELVVLSALNEEIWSTGKFGPEGLKYTLRIDDSGLLELKDESKKLLWSFPHTLNFRLMNHYANNYTENKYECWTLCLKQEDTCIAINYHEPSNTCFLFNDKYIVVANDADWTTLSTLNLRSSDFYSHKNIRLINPINQIAIRSIEKCLVYCKSNSICVGISHVSNECYMFNSSVEFEKQQAWNTFSKEEMHTDLKFKASNLHLFNEYRFELVHSETDCVKYCQNDARCTAVSISNKTCYLFNSTFNAVEEPNWLTISTSTIHKRDMIHYENVRFVNHVAHFKSYTAHDCISRCKIKMQQCIGVSFSDDGMCYLFDNLNFFQNETTGWKSYTIEAKDFNNGIRYDRLKLPVSYNEVSNLTIEECWSMCKKSMPKCKAISWNFGSKFSNQKCYFFDKIAKIDKKTRNDDFVTISNYLIPT